MTKKWVYLFSQVEEAEKYVGDWEGVRSLLGGKGANLGEMTRIGVPVPPGFTMTTEACNAYLDAGEQLPKGLWDQTLEALKAVEKQTGKKFGDQKNPLLVSVRSGAKFSMPGMMDTVLNVGLNDETVPGMIELTGNERFVWDAYRRLLQMYGSVVLGISDEHFDAVMDARKEEKGVKLDTDLGVDDWQAICDGFKAVIEKEKGFPFPQDPFEQLKLGAEAVFKSWFGKRAVDYRNAANIRHDLGTGVNVQTMVFGNMGWDSGTGVTFTRDPATGEKVLYGDYLMNAQGEDVVAGIRNTKPIAELEKEMPQVFGEFVDICEKLEHHYREMQDVEFTIERGKLWMLQTRDGKRTAAAAVKIAVDMANEGIIDRRTAIGKRVTTEQVDMLLHPQFDLEAKNAAKDEGKLLATGVNASPGAAVGMLAFDADTAEKWGKEEDKAVIMIRPETKPEDVHGMIAAKGILTSRGGATSHAAVVARQFGTPAVVGCEALEINLEKRTVTAAGVTLKEGDYVSLDGGAGEVFAGHIPTVETSFEEQKDLGVLLGWADEICAQEGTRQWPGEPVYKSFPTRGLQVWANADYPHDAQRARSYGARGIGLCRTEHMFFEEERLPIVQKMILSKSDEEREKYLNQLLPFQQADFEGLFRAMDGLPVIIRLIDPPLHEFLPSLEELLVEVTEMRVKGQTGPQLEEKEKLLAAVENMQEANPMMGLRGIRLGITLPGITKMQVRAIFQAACTVAQEGVDVHPEVMIPLTGHVNELKVTRKELEEVAKDVMAAMGEIDYKFGTMIEIPRAALTADDVAGEAQFFSYGTNDLTQMTFGYSRDDAERGFLLQYVEDGILPQNPFQVLDRDGVGQLVKMGAKLGRSTQPDLEVGICGEHGGEPSSIEFCHLAGLNYVSCSPFRVPVARLAAAQAAIKHGPQA